MIKVTWRSLKTKGLNTPVMDMFFVFVGESNFYVYKKWSKDQDLEHRASFFLFKFQPSRGSQKIRFKLHPGHLTCDPPPPGSCSWWEFLFPFSSFRGFVCRWGFVLQRCFLKSVGNLKKISIVCNQILPKKKKQSFARKFVGCFFFRMEGGSKPGELSVEMGCHL